MSNRFRVYDKVTKEILKMEDDYTFRANDGRLIFTLTEAFQAPRMLTVQENTGFQDMRNMDIFEGDEVLFSVRGTDHRRFYGEIIRNKSGAFVVRKDGGFEHPIEDISCDITGKVGK